MTDKTGGAAFPVSATELHGTHTGMTLRDYFAAKAIQGILSGHDADMYPINMSYWAELSYSIADAMLRARGK